jgi:TetR/AcrR family transcriptional repressor of nem operon
MRVSREQAAENREKILNLAANMFRERGFDGIGIADLMKAAGLTHGGFYGHFSSKEDLMAQACTRAVDDMLQSAQTRQAEQANQDRYRVFVTNYLSMDHRNNRAEGCLMAALGAEAARQSPEVRSAFTQGAMRVLKTVMSLVQGKSTEAQAREKALLILATLVGAQVIARALDDPELSQEVLQTVEQSLLNDRNPGFNLQDIL